MSNINFYKKVCAVELLLLASMPAFANDISGSVSILAGQSDNGGKTDSNQIDENQNEYEFSLLGDYQNSLLIFNANYSAKQQTFSEATQEDKSYLEGQSSLQIGDEQDVASLLITQSQRNLLSSPGELNLTDNQDERSVLTVAPSLRAKFGGLDSLVLTGSYADIRYRRDELRDSNRSGADLNWVHQLSKISQFYVSAQYNKIEFDATPLANYNYQSFLFNYSVKLHHLSYELRAGYNKTDTELEEAYSAPSLGLDMSYVSGPQRWTLMFNRAITDTSYGNGNDSEVGGIPGSDGSNQIDQIDRREVRLNWTGEVLCGRCTFDISLARTDDNYLSSDEQSLLTDALLNFGYQFSKRLTLSLGVEGSKNTFENSLIGQDYKSSYIRSQLSYTFNNGLAAGLLVRREERKSINTDTVNSGQNYSENYVGVNITWSF